MEVHLPKPLHGWREFVGEVGIIVLGVLIALGFEQLVDQWRWHREVGSTRQAIANELVEAANQGAMRIAVEDCLRDRIGDLAAKLRASNGRWTARFDAACPRRTVDPSLGQPKHGPSLCRAAGRLVAGRLGHREVGRSARSYEP